MNEGKQETAKFITLYHKQHWGGMTIKRLRIGWYKWYKPFYEWEKGGRVIRRPLLPRQINR